MFVHDYIRQHALEAKGIISEPIKKLPDLDSLKQTEKSERFETLCHNRLIMGAFRYGQLNEAGKSKYNRIDSIRQRLDLYDATGNQEHLVDIANLCMLEFEEPNHKKAHWKAIDDGIHTKKYREYIND